MFHAEKSNTTTAFYFEIPTVKRRVSVWTLIPEELLIHIYRHLIHDCNAPRDLYQCAQVCKYWAHVLRRSMTLLFGMTKQVDLFHKISHGYQIFQEQFVMLWKRRQPYYRHRKFTAIQAPMGSGKTAVMLYLAIKWITTHTTDYHLKKASAKAGKSLDPLAWCVGDRVLLLINTRIYTTWIKELRQFGLRLHQKYNQSDVLVLHTKYPEHRRMFEEAKWTDPKDCPRLILTTTHYLMSGYHRYRWGWNHWFDMDCSQVHLIVDEAHLLTTQHWENIPTHMFNTVTMFSASYMDSLPQGSRLIQIQPKRKGYPKLQVDWVSWWSMDFLTELEKLVHNPPPKPYRRIVIFSDESMKMLRHYVKQSAWKKPHHQDWKKPIVFSNTAPTTLDRWRRSEEPSILLCTYNTASEGTNFSECDMAWFFGFHRNALERSRQILGRIRRKDSHHDTIKVRFFEPADPVHLIRGRLNQLYACNLQMRPFSRKSYHTCEGILRQLQDLNYTVQFLSEEDLKILFSYDQVEPIDWDKLTIRKEHRRENLLYWIQLIDLCIV